MKKIAQKTISLAFQGGGAKGLAYCGALRALQERRDHFKVSNVVGSSAGSLIALLTAMDVPHDETQRFLTIGDSEMGSIKDVQDRIPEQKRRQDFDKNFNNLEDIMSEGIHSKVPWYKAYKEWAFDYLFLPQLESVLNKFGGVMTELVMHGKEENQHLLYEMIINGEVVYGQQMVTILERFLEKYSGDPNITMAGFKERFKTNLIVTASDLEANTLRIFSPHTSPDLPVKYACRISSGFPFYFPPLYWQNSWGKYMGSKITGNRLVDGGLVMNLPTTILHSSKEFQMKYIGQVVDTSSIFSFTLNACPKPKTQNKKIAMPKEIRPINITQKPVILTPDYLLAARRNAAFQRLDIPDHDEQPIPGFTILSQVISTIINSQQLFSHEAYQDSLEELDVEGISTLDFELHGIDVDSKIEGAYQKSFSLLDKYANT